MADDRAVRGNPARAARLASALVKVARLDAGRRAADPRVWSLLHQPVLLETRVRRLLRPSSPSLRPAGGPLRITAGAVLFLAALAAAWAAGLPERLQWITESVVAGTF